MKTFSKKELTGKLVSAIEEILNNHSPSKSDSLKKSISSTAKNLAKKFKKEFKKANKKIAEKKTTTIKKKPVKKSKK